MSCNNYLNWDDCFCYIFKDISTESKLTKELEELEERVLESAIVCIHPKSIKMIFWMQQFLKFRDLLLLAVFFI